MLASRSWPGSSSLWVDPAPLAICMENTAELYFFEDKKGRKLFEGKGKEEEGNGEEKGWREREMGRKLGMTEKYVVKAQLRFIRALLKSHSYDQSSFLRLFALHHKEKVC